MEIFIFTIVAIALYFVSDAILNRIEIALKRRLEYRTVVFFALLFGLAMLSFWLLRLVLGDGGGGAASAYPAAANFT